PVAAANVDEDLDYRIAERMKSIEGWRWFLEAHPDGPHARSARAELGELVAAQTPPAAEAVRTSNGGSPETKTRSDAASQSQPSQGYEDATLATNEFCGRDEDPLERSNSRSSDETLRCDKLGSQLSRLTELNHQDPTPAQDPAPTVATQGHSSPVATQ